MNIGCLSIAGVAALVLAAGCAKSNRAESATESTKPPPAVAVEPYALPAPANVENSFNSPDALARKAQNYSREIEPHLTRLAPGPSAPPSIPSIVQWSDPGEFHLGNVAPPAPDPQPPAAPGVPRAAIQSSPSEANAVVEPLDASPQTPVEPHAVTAAANTPAPAPELFATPSDPAAVASGVSAGQLAEKLSARIREYPRDVSSHLEYQLLQLLQDEQVPQLAALASLPTEDRELITAVLDGLSLFRSTLRSDNNMLLSAKIRPLVEMADRLKSQADLSIPTVTLCRSVAGFGKYDPIEPARFTAGVEHRAIVYCEVANFSSILDDQRQWETRLKQELVLYTELFGAAVWEDKSETIVDTARNRRHDFFVNKRIVIPGNLAVGRYLLKVSIVDLHANRVAEASVPLVIVAQ